MLKRVVEFVRNVKIAEENIGGKSIEKTLVRKYYKLANTKNKTRLSMYFILA